jgi:hypothetical protein
MNPPNAHRNRKLGINNGEKRGRKKGPKKTSFVRFDRGPAPRHYRMNATSVLTPRLAVIIEINRKKRNV